MIGYNLKQALKKRDKNEYSIKINEKELTLLYLSFEYLVYFKHNLVLGWIIGGMYAWEEMNFIDLYDDTIKCFNFAENFFLYSVFVVSFFFDQLQYKLNWPI